MWKENWIPGIQSFKPLFRRPGVEAELVSDLFVPGTRVWDEIAVRGALMQLEADEVLKIKPGGQMPNDVVAWAKTYCARKPV